MWLQIDGLLGGHGVTPAAKFLDAISRSLDLEKYWQYPTIFWLGCGDLTLHLVCAVSCILALAALFGMASPVCFALLWFLYLSLTVIGQTFWGFQWDNLLLESGFLAIFLGPFSPNPFKTHKPASFQPHPLPLLLFHWLLFRLMFLSGLVKFLSPEPNTWRDLTALNFHFFTQPLPPWTAWYFHHFPEWMLKTSTALMFVIEIPIALLILGPRRLRHISALCQAALMILIIISGNYGFFNLLTLFLCILLLDDSFYPRKIAVFFLAASSKPHADQVDEKKAPFWALLPLTCLIIVQSSIAFGLRLHLIPETLSSLIRAYSWTYPFRSVNSYGLFASMTTERPEIILEGSRDGIVWKEYRFKWKPGPLDSKPGFVEPYQPRLDWQMWFAALGRIEHNPWLVNLMIRILQNSKPVLDLLAENPFPEAPPQYIRAKKYLYTFTSLEEKRKNGQWWNRVYQGPYTGILSKDQVPPLDAP